MFYTLYVLISLRYYGSRKVHSKLFIFPKKYIFKAINIDYCSSLQLICIFHVKFQLFLKVHLLYRIYVHMLKSLECPIVWKIL